MLLRKKMGLSQRGLAERLQLVGMDFDKTPFNVLSAENVL